MVLTVLLACDVVGWQFRGEVRLLCFFLYCLLVIDLVLTDPGRPSTLHKEILYFWICYY